MAIAEVQLPDGRIVELEVPAGTSDEQILNFVQQNMDQFPSPLSTEAQQLPPEQQRGMLQALEAQRQAAGVPGDLSPTATASRQQFQEGFPMRPEETRAAQQLPEIGQGGLLAGEDSVRAAAVAPALLTATDPQEMASILTSNFPNIGIAQDPGGNLIAANNATGAQVVLNQPGLSQLDLLQGLGIASAFFPASAGISGTSRGALTQLAGRSAATQAAIEGVQAVSGGEFDPEQVIGAAVAAPAGQVVGERLLSPVARFAGGKISNAARQLIDEAKRRNVPILTTDLAPPESFFGKSLQQIGEKLGPLGTGSKRAAQQKARVDMVEEIARNIDASLDDTATSTQVIRSLEKGVAKRLEKAAIARNAALDELDQFGVTPIDNALGAIDDQLARQARLRGQADTELVKRLTDLRDDLQNADFRLLADFRSNLSDDIRAAFRGEVLSSKAAAPLQAVKSAIDKDMVKFAKEKSRQAAGNWIRSNKLFADSFRKAKETDLKRILQAGTETPENLARKIKGGRLSELRRVDRFLDDKGRQAARNAIIRDALEESGFFQSGANPDRFATALGKAPRQRAINVFFKGENRKQIEGVRRLLDATRRAQQTRAGTTTGLAEAVPAASLLATGAGAVVDPVSTGALVGLIAGSSRAFESPVVRNALIRLASAPKGSQAEQRILNQVLPGVVSALQAARSEAQ